MKPMLIVSFEHFFFLQEKNPLMQRHKKEGAYEL